MKAKTREDVIRTMPKNAVVAELGVWRGKFAKFIWETAKPKELHLIDCWAPQKELGKIESLVAQPMAQYDQWFQEARDRLEGEEGVFFHRIMTADMAAHFEDAYFDWIYIDADHTYEGCSSDLSLYYPKVKKGGFIIADDYCPEGLNYYGVKRAVDEFCEKNGLSFELFRKLENDQPHIKEAVIRV